MENYEQKYVEKVKYSIDGDDEAILNRDDLETVFPELKESEDNKIRKAICYVLNQSASGLIDNTGFTVSQMEDWLEKQGESDETKAKRFLMNKGYPIDANGTFPTYEEMYNIIREGLEEQDEQKSTDKVKPKFKVGDLVKYTNHNKQPIYKVNHIDKECYVCTSDDATLGDKAIMHSAFDNPYLRLVEQKPSDEDIKALLRTEYEKGRADVIAEMQMEWSEEDENRMKKVMHILSLDGRISNAELQSIYAWLIKSLRPQNIYNPYKAVVESIAEMCKHYDKASHSGLRDFYDNVKVKCKDAQEYDKMFPQAQWKPSDEQMELLSEVQNALLGKDCHNRFTDFMWELKKLKEEKV